MPVLPLIDLLILVAWTLLFGAFSLKTIRIATTYQPTILGLGPFEITVVAAVLLLFAIALGLRGVLRSLEMGSLAARERAASTLAAYSAVQDDARKLDKRKTSQNHAMGNDPAAERPSP